MSSFQDLDKTGSQEPWGRSPEKFRAVGVEHALSFSGNHEYQYSALKSHPSLVTLYEFPVIKRWKIQRRHF